MLLQLITEHVDDFSQSAAAGGGDFAAAETRLGELLAGVERAALGKMLRSMDPKDERVEVDGKSWRRLHPTAAETYSTLRGEVRVERGLYRQEGNPEGATVVPMERRAGIVEGRYTPAAARAVATVFQAMPSRDAELLCQVLGILPYSRAAQHRTAVDIGERWETIHERAEAEIGEAMDIPAAAAAVSLSVDRISLPMSEPRPLTAEDIAAGIRNPIAVNWRMAFTAAIVLYDRDANPLTTIRYAHVPTSGASTIEASLRRDVATLVRRRPGLRVATVADGAPEMQSILDRATSGVPVTARMVDFWHFAECLAGAIRSMGAYVDDQLGDWKELLLERDDAVEAIEATLREWAGEYETGKEPGPLHAALTYIANHRDRLRYATARAAGLPIGSGAVEATGKTVVAVRMKRAGSRWKPAGAQAVMSLRALATSSPERWSAGLNHVLNTYKSPVTPLSQRPRRRSARRV